MATNCSIHYLHLYLHILLHFVSLHNYFFLYSITTQVWVLQCIDILQTNLVTSFYITSTVTTVSTSYLSRNNSRGAVLKIKILLILLLQHSSTHQVTCNCSSVLLFTSSGSSLMSCSFIRISLFGDDGAEDMMELCGELPSLRFELVLLLGMDRK